MAPRRPPRSTRADGKSGAAQRARRTHLAAWLVTGPLGHAYGGVADWASLAARYAWARVRGKDPQTL